MLNWLKRSLGWGFTTGDYQIPDQQAIDGLLPLVDDSAITLDGTSATLPTGAQLDSGAVAKGYAGDRAAELLKDAGVTSALLNLGSSTIRAIGSKPDGSPWRIALQDPNDTSAYAGVVSATDLSIDTSGGVVFLFYVFTGILFSVRPPVAPSFVARRKIGEKGVPRGCGPLNPLGLMFWRILTCCVPTFSQRCI